MNTDQNEIEKTLNRRRIGKYGHFVMPLSQLLDDVSEFLGGRNVKDFCSEIARFPQADQGVHPEEAAILYAMVRAYKPDLVLETGTFMGYSTSEIARGLQLNGAGHLLTVDCDPDAGSMVPNDLKPFVTFYRGESSDALPPRLKRESRHLNLFFHDSLHTYRNAFGELVWFAPFFAHDCLIVCHDAKMDYKPGFGVGRAVREFAEALRLPYRILDTTCGLAVMRWSPDVTAAQLVKLCSECASAQSQRGIKPMIRKLARKCKGLLVSK